MDQASLSFIGFGLAAAILSNLSSSRRWRTGVLLAASLIFLAFLLAGSSVLALVPLVGFLLLGYLGVIVVERGWARSHVLAVLTVIAAYLWLKKYTFLPEQSFLAFPYFTLGLSYIFFRVLQLVIDAQPLAKRRLLSPISYLTYMINFTTFVSGPIQRYNDFAADQFAPNPMPLDAEVIGYQAARILRGFFKVNVLAMLLHALQQDALLRLAPDFPANQKIGAAFTVAVVYPFFLYANFSGYMDIVIALARLMRLRLPENFNRPFSASSFLDFWNRWHITLSLWLQTYVYNPLLLFFMRRISSPTLQLMSAVFSFFVTFFLVGIWHGRTSEFVIFGVLQGGGVAINKLWQITLTRSLGKKEYKQLAKNRVYIAFGRGLTFSWFAFTLFWFWANWQQIHSVSSAVSAPAWALIWIGIWLSATTVLAFWEALRARLFAITTSEGPLVTSSYALVVYSCVFGLAAILITVVLNQPAPDVIYKAF